MSTTHTKSLLTHSHTPTHKPARIPRPHHLNIEKRQSSNSTSSNNTIGTSGLSPEAQELETQVNTALYSFDLINIGSNLNGTCQQLRASANITSGAAIGINLTQAADFVCAAYAANLTYIDPSIVQVFSAALYALNLASNFTGTTNTSAICASLAFNTVTLDAFGVNGTAVQNYVCSATPVATTFTTTTVTATVPPAANTVPAAATTAPAPAPAPAPPPGTVPAPGSPAGTIVPYPSSNQTMAGTGTAAVSYGTAPYVTGPVATNTGSSSSGWPYSANLTLFPTGSGSVYGSGYAYASGTPGSGDPMSIDFSVYYNPSTLRLPPSPNTAPYYPAFSSSSSSASVYGYGYGYAG